MQSVPMTCWQHCILVIHSLDAGKLCSHRSKKGGSIPRLVLIVGSSKWKAAHTAFLVVALAELTRQQVLHGSGQESVEGRTADRSHARIHDDGCGVM